MPKEINISIEVEDSEDVAVIKEELQRLLNDHFGPSFEITLGEETEDSEETQAQEARKFQQRENAKEIGLTSAEINGEIASMQKTDPDMAFRSDNAQAAEAVIRLYRRGEL